MGEIGNLPGPRHPCRIGRCQINLLTDAFIIIGIPITHITLFIEIDVFPVNITSHIFQFISVVDSAGTDMTPSKLLETFCDDGMSNYIIVYLRLIASCQLQMESEFYQNFVDNGKTVVEFCKTVSDFILC